MSFVLIDSMKTSFLPYCVTFLDRIQLCREILSIIGRNIPHPEVPATSTHLLKFRKSVTFLIESVGIPAIFIRHCQAQKLSSVGMSREVR